MPATGLARTLPQLATREDDAEAHQAAAALAARTFLDACRRGSEASAADRKDVETRTAEHRDHMETEGISSHRGNSQRGGDAQILLAAVASLDKGDYAAAFRAFSVLETSIASVLSGATTTDDRVAACRYFLNFGVCAATCGLHDRASVLFERAQRIAIVDSKDGTLLEACHWNLRVVRKHAAEAQRLDASWLARTSVDMAAEYYTFVNTTAATKVREESVKFAASASTDRRENVSVASSLSTSSALPAPLADLIASSVLSNARSSMQVDTTPMGRTKLCVMVSRPDAAKELAWYFSTMNDTELHRPMEMRVKGEASIDGGYGGVTNDIVGVFFREVLEMALSQHGVDTGAASPPQSKSAPPGVGPADHFYALGVLMVKCFVEGRSFSVLRRLLVYDTVVQFVLATTATPSIPSSPLQAFLQWVPDATRRWGSLRAVSSVLQNDLRRMDRETGSTFAAGVDWYWQQRESNAMEWHEAFLPLCAGWINEVSSLQDIPGWSNEAATLAEVQRLMFLWDKVLWSRYDVISNVRRGVSFAANILPDIILSSTLSGALRAEYDASLECAIVKLFQRTVCGGDAHGPVVTGKDVVERLEFRGWGAADRAEAPYILCSWLHQASPQMAEDFLALCTGMTALPFEPSAATDRLSAHPKMPGIIVMPTALQLYARTCFFTLYIPKWEGCSVAEAHACIDAAVCAFRHSAVMHEVDIS
jgi:hypothetical protein